MLPIFLKKPLLSFFLTLAFLSGSFFSALCFSSQNSPPVDRSSCALACQKLKSVNFYLVNKSASLGVDQARFGGIKKMATNSLSLPSTIELTARLLGHHDGSDMDYAISEDHIDVYFYVDEESCTQGYLVGRVVMLSPKLVHQENFECNGLGKGDCFEKMVKASSSMLKEYFSGQEQSKK
ncbi:MAG TPA: hypothetical protein VIM59_13035 [Cellvibrio sp.]